MVTLYEMTNNFKDLFDQFDEFTTDDEREAWFDTLDGMEQEIKTKAEAVAVYIKTLKVETAALKEEEDNLKARRKAKENACASMINYLKTCMESVGLTKIDTPKALISLRNTPLSLNILDENAFIEWAEKHNESFLKYSAPEIRKSAVKNAIVNDGIDVPFTELESHRSVVIK